MIKRLHVIFLLLLGAVSVNAQDLHFTQFHMSPLTLNPAMTGLFNGNFRLTANYRNQWQSILPNTPFRTFAGSVELSGKSGQDNRIGIGLHIFSDQAGSLNLSKTSVSGSVGYLMALTRTKDYYIAAGIQAAYTNSSYNYLNITTGNQWQDGKLNGDAATGETYAQPTTTYLDAGMGFMWYHIRNVRNYQYVGGSAFHINRPEYAFLTNSGDEGRRLYAKYVVHFGAGITVGPRFDVVPYALGMLQGPSFEFNTGAFAKFMLDERKNSAYGGTAFYIGPFYRIVGNNDNNVGSDAVILATKLDVESVTFGLSYDINISGLARASTGRGGPEFAIQYIGAFKNKHVKSFCPKF